MFLQNGVNMSALSDFLKTGYGGGQFTTANMAIAWNKLPKGTQETLMTSKSMMDRGVMSQEKATEYFGEEGANVIKNLPISMRGALMLDKMSPSAQKVIYDNVRKAFKDAKVEGALSGKLTDVELDLDVIDSASRQGISH